MTPEEFIQQHGMTLEECWDGDTFLPEVCMRNLTRLHLATTAGVAEYKARMDKHDVKGALKTVV